MVHFVIVHRETTGFEVPHTFLYLGKEVMPVFSSAAAARRFLASLALGDTERDTTLIALYYPASLVAELPTRFKRGPCGALCFVLSTVRARQREAHLATYHMMREKQGPLSIS